MLELKNISKTYSMGELKVEALKDISISFRKNEFVSILGPSGCGKTTLLNIVGGLDKYTSGDLIIENKSTKDFTDKDWDAYRNSKIGFVFQSYNLIPHLTVLENVELSLTLSGIKAKERKSKAKQALRDVGLLDVINKKPNQLSGGQMQRVAIARALVNDPQIILADEPTGALDSETSVQIMEILKNISSKKLIIMVTHNKELADKYSTRIINILDGKITNDSSPFNPKKKAMIVNKKDKTSMSLFTAFNLSFKNLFSKKTKTFLTSFAGSIGIIGIALILAVSNGFTGYINNIQRDTLSNYPISISSIAIDYNALTGGTLPDLPEKGEEGNLTIYDISKIIGEFGHFNYLSPKFVNYINDYYKKDQAKEEPELSSLKIQYSSKLNILTEVNGNIIKLDTSTTTSSIYGTTSSLFFEGFDDKNFVLSYYDVIEGTYPQNQNEIALIVGENNTISKQQLDKLGITYTSNPDGTFQPISTEDFIGKSYKVIVNDDYYVPVYDSNSNLISFKKSEEYLDLYNSANSITLNISGVLKLKEDATSSLFDEGLMYLPEFSEMYKENCKNSLIATKTLENQTIYEPFEIDVSELKSFLGNSNPFVFTDPNSMKFIIENQYGIEITLEEVLDLALQSVGASSIPTGIFVYPTTFDAKQNFINYVSEWNSSNDGLKNKIVYTDVTGFLTSTLGQLVNIISYVLIAFSSVSLIVSSIMIGIITYTSVIERTKEIGVLRSIGARKKDISRLFNAETATIGFISGIIGIAVTYLFCPIINIIINTVAGTNVGQIAMLNPLHAIILVLISVVLTLISGFIPSRIASKKDPVVALRTE